MTSLAGPILVILRIRSRQTGKFSWVLNPDPMMINSACNKTLEQRCNEAFLWHQNIYKGGSRDFLITDVLKYRIHPVYCMRQSWKGEMRVKPGNRITINSTQSWRFRCHSFSDVFKCSFTTKCQSQEKENSGEKYKVKKMAFSCINYLHKISRALILFDI